MTTESFLTIYHSHSNIGNIYVVYIHVPGRRYDVNHFHPQVFVSEQSLPSLSIFCSFWVVSRRYRSCQFDFTRLFILFRVTLSYNFCQQVFLGGFEFFPRQSFRCTFNFQSEFLDAGNLTCLHPLSPTPYTNYYSFKNSCFGSV